MRIQIIVADPRLRDALLDVVRGAGYPADAMPALDPGTSAACADQVVIDVRGPEELAAIREIRAKSRGTRIIAIGADPSAVLATQTRRAGAHEFLRTPFGIDALEAALLAEPSASAGRNADEFLTGDDRMRDLLAEIDRAAATDATIRIQGESGTGKALLARRIHDHSMRRAQPYVVVGCAGLTVPLAETELFGQLVGRRLDAHEGRVGRLAAASGGTLVLDEVAELSLELQPKLLRAIQEREIQPLGGRNAEPIDVRWIATSRKDLAEEVERGRFRPDLHFRLDVIEFRIPPLRERPADIRVLAIALLDRFARQQGTEPPRLSDDSISRLEDLPFRGNVRELENMMRRATILFAGREVDLEALLSHKVATAIPQATIDTFNLRELEKETIRRALAARGGNRTQAARALGISVRTLRNKIQAYDLRAAFPSDHANRAGHVSP